MSSIEAAVRAWAQGMYPTEAGVELLIRGGKAVYENAPWITELEPGDTARPRMAAIDVDNLLAAAGAWSGGEQRVVRIAASLLGGPPVDLSEDLSSLDRGAMTLVLAAFAHANGSHQHSEMVVTPDGTGVSGIVRLPTLYPWPEG